MRTNIYFQSPRDENKFKSLPHSLLCKPAESSVIHAKRNTIWITEQYATAMVIKRFSHGVKSNFIYTFRASKAKRSLKNAVELTRRGIATPRPIAYAEARNALGILQRSWYVSEYEKSLSYNEALSVYGDSLIDDFAEFVAELHVKGILHNDFNSTNVRVTVNPHGNFRFSLIDLNRMRIYAAGHAIPDSMWMKDVCRFCSISHGFKRFASQYLKVRDLPATLLHDMIMVKKRHDRKDIFRHKLKSFFRL